jgi:hypothetical protein
MLVRGFEWNQEFSGESMTLCDEELRFVLKCMGNTCSVCCSDHTNIAHVSAGNTFWIFVDWDSCSIKWVLYPVKACNPSFSTLYSVLWQDVDEWWVRKDLVVADVILTFCWIHWEKPRNILFRIAGVPAEILTENLTKAATTPISPFEVGLKS